MHEFLILENSTINALSGLKSEGLKTLAPYSGELDEKNIAALTYQFPCVYATAGSLTSECENMNDRVKLELILIVGARNLRGCNEAAGGDNGVYEWLEKAGNLLHRRLIIPGWRPFTRSREYPLALLPKQNICVYAARYLTEFKKTGR